jgi:hypothetical protein
MHGIMDKVASIHTVSPFMQLEVAKWLVFHSCLIIAEQPSLRVFMNMNIWRKMCLWG